jgi:uncharacterized membrane protein YhaH (DUF805 family)
MRAMRFWPAKPAAVPVPRGAAVVLHGVAAPAMLLPGIAVGARRLHDIDKTGCC